MKQRENSVHVRNPNYDVKLGKLEQRARMSRKWRRVIKDSLWSQNPMWALRRYPRSPPEICITICTSGPWWCSVLHRKTEQSKSRHRSVWLSLHQTTRGKITWSMPLIKQFPLRIFKNSCARPGTSAKIRKATQFTRGNTQFYVS